MFGAAIWHAGRSETTQIGLNVLNAAIALFIAYGDGGCGPSSPGAV
jgi:hypothetical protein